eukprot:9481620-Pyramimonas_sp.AAC.1
MLEDTPMRGMRALGPRPPGDQGYAGQIRRRCEAMQTVLRLCGRFRSSGATGKMKKYIFQAFVSGAGLSGQWHSCWGNATWEPSSVRRQCQAGGRTRWTQEGGATGRSGQRRRMRQGGGQEMEDTA